MTLSAEDYHKLREMLRPGAFVSEDQGRMLLAYLAQMMAWIEAALPLLDSYDSLLCDAGDSLARGDRATMLPLLKGFIP